MLLRMHAIAASTINGDVCFGRPVTGTVASLTAVPSTEPRSKQRAKSQCLSDKTEAKRAAKSSTRIAAAPRALAFVQLQGGAFRL